MRRMKMLLHFPEMTGGNWPKIMEKLDEFFRKRRGLSGCSLGSCVPEGT